jgi:hypothetical protein
MIEDTPGRKRAVSPPVLILEDDMIRAGEMLAEIEDLGLAGRILAARSGLLQPDQVYSLVILSVRSMTPPDLRIPETIRRYSPDVPMLLLCAEADPGSAPWTNCTVLRKKGALSKIRARVAEMLGIVLTDEPGTTLKSS